MQLEFSYNRIVCFIKPKTHLDNRGGFTETFVDNWFRNTICNVDFVQDNEVYSRTVGTIRGLHYQSPPRAQGKLVRCSAGAIFDVTVDLRPSSPNFRQWMSAHLSAANQRQVWVPPGFAHGLCTLENDTIVSYKVTSAFSPEHDKGIAWDDSELAIKWPALADPSTLSEKDRNLPPLNQLSSPTQDRPRSLPEAVS